MKQRKLTLKDVAKAAKVSAATVSRVANGNPHVEPQIQAQVVAVAQRLGIDLSQGRKTRSVAFVVGNRNALNEFQSQVLLGAEEYCGQQGWDLLFVSILSDLGAPTSNIRLPEALTRKSAPRGVILAGTHHAAILTLLNEQRIPFAVMGNNVIGDWNSGACDSVGTDGIRGAAEITEHLIALGHRAIHFIGDVRLPWYGQCAQGYRQAMEAARLEPSFSRIHSDERELGYLATKSLLSGKDRPTAIFAGNDQAAVGVYAALQESGVRIPDDVSVVGFNDTIGSVLHPALTTVREFPREQGRQLAELILRRIEEPNGAPQTIVIPTELIRRDSVRAVESRTGRK